MIRDLSEVHRPIGPLFPQPNSDDEWDRLRLSPEQLKFFQHNGYLSGVRILDDGQIDALRAALERLTEPNHPGRELFYEFHSNESTNPSDTLFHALGAWRIEEAFHDILWSPAFVMAATQLLGGDIRFWHDQLFCKPAHHGGVVAWHQDYSYWTRTEPMAHLTCWIGLDDSTVDNGCLHYVPGSHRWRLLPVTGLTGNMDEIMTVLSDAEKAAFEPVAIKLKRGECSFHHPLMVHGSYANRSASPRRATVINVFRDGTRSASGETLLDGVPPIPSGQPMQGQFFPRLPAHIE